MKFLYYFYVHAIYQLQLQLQQYNTDNIDNNNKVSFVLRTGRRDSCECQLEAKVNSRREEKLQSTCVKYIQYTHIYKYTT